MKNLWDNIWLNDSYSDPSLRKLKAKYKLDLFCDDICINSDTICVDIGCGGGYISRELYKNYKCKIYSCDNSSVAIDFALKHNKFENCNYLLNPANQIELPDATADLVICIGVLEHIENIESALSEINRILKNDGKFVIISSNYYSLIFIDRIIKQLLNKWKYGYQKNWKPSKLKKLLIENGFCVKKINVHQGFGDFGAINSIDRIINSIAPFWGRYIKIIGEKND